MSFSHSSQKEMYLNMYSSICYPNVIFSLDSYIKEILQTLSHVGLIKPSRAVSSSQYVKISDDGCCVACTTKIRPCRIWEEGWNKTSFIETFLFLRCVGGR